MLPVVALSAWHDFFVLVGTAAATMIGLLFVAASVGSGVFSTDRRAPLRVFLSASVVNFSLILASSLIALAPWQAGAVLGSAIGACGGFGLVHSALAWRDTLRDGLIRSIDLVDRTWYLAMPMLGYAVLAGAGGALAEASGAGPGGHAAAMGPGGLAAAMGPVLLAGAIGVLLTTGIHNAWDITVWIIARRRE